MRFASAQHERVGRSPADTEVVLDLRRLVKDRRRQAPRQASAPALLPAITDGIVANTPHGRHGTPMVCHRSGNAASCRSEPSRILATTLPVMRPGRCRQESGAVPRHCWHEFGAHFGAHRLLVRLSRAAWPSAAFGETALPSAARPRWRARRLPRRSTRRRWRRGPDRARAGPGGVRAGRSRRRWRSQAAAPRPARQRCVPRLHGRTARACGPGGPPCNGSCIELGSAVEAQGSRSIVEPKQSAVQKLVLPWLAALSALVSRIETGDQLAARHKQAALQWLATTQDVYRR